MMNDKNTSQPAKTAREKLQDDAKRIGITTEYISDLVDHFYERIRQDPELGDIFMTAIGEEWEPHLKTMKRFWASVALNTGSYSGKPVQVHQALTSQQGAPLMQAHFARWLALFRLSLAETAPSEEAEAFFTERANRIAHSLQMGISYGMLETHTSS
jgi:hemoglobin